MCVCVCVCVVVRSSGMHCKLTELQHKEVVLLGQLGELQSR